MAIKSIGQKFATALSAEIMARQKAYLREAQERMDLGPTDMAKMLDTNFNTYKAWLYGRNPMPGIVYLALDCILRNLPANE